MEAILRTVVKEVTVKNIFDFFAALVGLVLFLPIMLLVAIAIRIIDGGPVFYTQKRVGLNGTLFNLYKFRTMCVGAHEMRKQLECLNERDGPTFKINRDPRCIPYIGHFLRKYCLDEFPQLINVLLGDMSVVGPRPALPEEVEQYKEWQCRRLSAKPGLTCYWQISNRDMTFNEWVQSDIEYVSHNNIWTDMKIILLTIPVLWRGHH
jgi:lipopolysaccharide/colanic/teichoic acid biosynthesis glycosyltransferase